MYTATELYPNTEVGNAVHEYCIEHSTPVPKHLDEHRQATIEWCAAEGDNADMMINTLQVCPYDTRSFSNSIEISLTYIFYSGPTPHILGEGSKLEKKYVE